MRKVRFNIQAEQDLSDIVIGLLHWEKIKLTEEQALQYVDDIYDSALEIAKTETHTPCRYKEHLEYGTYFVRYRRNSRTVWYIIYNVYDNCIYIEKIINNYMTID